MFEKKGEEPSYMKVLPPEGFEVHGRLRQVADRLFFVPFLNLFPSNLLRKFLWWSGVSVRVVMLKATRFEALEEIYKHPLNETQLAFWERVWNSLNNACALRNRLKLVKKLLTRAVGESESEINLFSLGSGSGRAVLEFLAEVKPKNIQKVTFFDISREALEASKAVAKNLGVDRNYNFAWIRGSIRDVKPLADHSPSVIEMVGLLDYFQEAEAIQILSGIYKALLPKGVLIVGNVRRNDETPFVEKTLRWPLVYREPDEFFYVITESGFPPEGIKIYYEPLKIHGVAYCKKL